MARGINIKFGTTTPYSMQASTGRAWVAPAPISMLSSMPVGSFDFYISPTGSDSNAGTSSSPWAITAINSKRATYKGKRVGIMDGTYNVRSLIQAGDGQGYAPGLQMNGAGGTNGSPTVIQAVNQGAAIIDSGLPTQNNPTIGTSDSATGYITLDGLKLINGGAKTVHFGFYGQNYNTPGIVIQNCEITGQDSSPFAAGGNFSSVELQGTLGAVIRNNYIHGNIGNKAPNSGDHFSPIIQWYGHSTLYEYNTLLGPGFHGKEDGNAGTIIRYNYVDNTGWTTVYGIEDFVGKDTSNTPTGLTTTVHHNVMKTNLIDMRPELAFTSSMPDPFVCFNNTFIGLSGGSSCGPIICPLPGKATYFNNIHSSAQSGDVQFMTMVITGPGLMDYNLYFSTGDYKYGYLTAQGAARSQATTLATWKTAMSVPCEAHALDHVNPAFAATGTLANFYKLNGASPAVNAGTTTGLSSGTACDMGAWGYDPAFSGPPPRIGTNF